MKNDSTENWLRQTLSDLQPAAPTNAWQRLEPNLPEKRRRRLPVFWWKLAAIATVVAAFFLILKQKNVPTTAPTLEQIQPAALLPIEKTDAKPSSVLENTKPDFSKQHTFTEQPQVGFSKKKPLAGLHKIDSLENQQPKTLPKTAATSDVFFTQNPPVVFHFEKDLTLEKLPVQAGTPLAKMLSQPEIEPVFQPILPARRGAKSYFWFGFEAAPAIFMQKNIFHHPSALAFTEQPAHVGHGWQTGVSLAFQPKKDWRIALGFQHLQQTHEAGHQASLRLMDGVLLNPNDPGLKNYEFQYALYSGGQRTDLTVRLDQETHGSTMPADKFFVLDMKTTRHTTAWRVPLTVERHFGTGRWQGFVRGGAVLDFAQKSKLEVTHFSEKCRDLCFAGGHFPKIEAATTFQNSVGWLTAAGIERRFSRHAALRVEPFLVGQKGSLQGGLSLGVLFSN